MSKPFDIDGRIENRISRCCQAPLGFYDWFICGACGEFIHDPDVDADLIEPGESQ